jgi:hypothetical protein
MLLPIAEQRVSFGVDDPATMMPWSSLPFETQFVNKGIELWAVWTP